MKLSGSVALVTGGAQGIGKVYCTDLLKNGCKVCLADFNAEVGQATEKEMGEKFGKDKVLFVKCDVSNPQELEATFQRTIDKFGKLDILVNNAGICAEKEGKWEHMININFTALVRGTKLGFKYMGKDMGKNGGTIVNIASLTTYMPWEIIPVYSATKSAVNQFSRSYGTPLHYDKTGVRVISINPGLTDTAILKTAYGNLGDETWKEKFDEIMKEFKIQKPENMGVGLIEVLKKAKSGTMWAIEDDEPPKEVLFNVEKIPI